MRKKILKYDDYQKILSQLGLEFRDEIEEELNLTQKYNHRCNNCGVSSYRRPYAIMKSHSQGNTYSCKVCLTNSQRKTNEKYQQEALLIGFKPIEPYITARTPILHECMNCSFTFKKSPNRLSVCSFCPRCEINKQLCATKESYENNLKNKLFNRITMVEDFVSSSHKNAHRCNDCGYVWKVSPQFMMYHFSGCRKCASIRRTTSYSEYDTKLATLRNNEYIRLSGFLKLRDKILVRHLHCGYEWKTRAEGLLSGSNSCPSCARPSLYNTLDYKTGPFGTPTQVGDKIFRSKLEARCAEKLMELFEDNDIDFGKLYDPKQTRMNCDFYIKSLDLWIEISNFGHNDYLEKIYLKRQKVRNFIFANTVEMMIEMINEFINS